MASSSIVRLSAGVIAAGLIIGSLVILFSRPTAEAYILVNQIQRSYGELDDVEETRQIDCHPILDTDGYDWPLDEDGNKDDDTTYTVNNAPVASACGNQRVAQVALFVLLFVPGVGIGAAATAWTPRRETESADEVHPEPAN